MRSRRPLARRVLTTALLVVVATAGRLPAQSSSIVPLNVQTLLRQIKTADKEQMAISEEDGRFLRLLTINNRTQRALEIGGASGYSAIWIGLGLRETGGRLTTIEHDAPRAKQLADHIRRARLSDIVTVVSGDAFQENRSFRASSTWCSSTRGSATTRGFSI